MNFHSFWAFCLLYGKGPFSKGLLCGARARPVVKEMMVSLAILRLLQAQILPNAGISPRHATRAPLFNPVANLSV